MKILFVAHRIPYPPNKGDKIRSYHLLRGLALDHEVHLLALADRKEDLGYVDHLRSMCSTVSVEFINPRWAKLKSLKALLSPMDEKGAKSSMSSRYFFHPRLMAKAQHLMDSGSLDLAFAFSSTMYPYIDSFDGPKVLDMVDVDSEKFRLYGEERDSSLWRLWRSEAKRLRRLESYAAGAADLTLLATDDERGLCARLMTGKRIESLQNGVDLDAFPYEFNAVDRPSAVFVGAMDYKPNIEGALWFAKNVYPSLKRRFSEFRWTILGREPASSLKALHDGDGIVVTGTVPEITPFMRESSVSVAPLRVAQGIQNKVLESLALGTPVVATEEAARGIEVTSGTHLEVTHSQDEMIEAVAKLIEDRAHAGTLSRAGRALVEEKYGWTATHQRLESMLGEITGQTLTKTLSTNPQNQ